MFSTQNYFGEVAFVSVIWNAPLMVNLVIILVNFLRLTVKEMVKMKKAQMKRRFRESQKESGVGEEEDEKRVEKEAVVFRRCNSLFNDNIVLGMCVCVCVFIYTRVI